MYCYVIFQSCGIYTIIHTTIIYQSNKIHLFFDTCDDGVVQTLVFIKVVR